jgi:four helix bundle protein
MESYQRLTVWQRSMDLVEAIYKLSRAFPEHEQSGLTGQIRRAAVAIPTNIAEGHGRSHSYDNLQNLSAAHYALIEVETLLQVAQRLRYIPDNTVYEAWELSQDVERLLTAHTKSLQK